MTEDTAGEHARIEGAMPESVAPLAALIQPEAPANPGVTRWRKRPVVIEAVQWTGTNLAEVQAFAGGGYFDAVPPEDRAEDPDMTAEVYDKLHGTWVHVYDGQWIIRGIQGELYPCAGDVFAATYEPVPEKPLASGGVTTYEPAGEPEAPAVPSPSVAAALDPVAQLHRIADQDIGGNAPWLADKLHAFADQLAAEMRGECQIEAIQRAEAAEPKLAAVKQKAETWAALAPADDWGLTPTDTVAADCGRVILAIIGSGEEAAFARQLVAQAEAADAGYKVAAVRAALYEFLHQYGRSTLPTFKVAIDLAASLRKIIDEYGSEEGDGHG